MKKKQFLAAVLLGAIVSGGVGHREVEEWMDIEKVSYVDFKLLDTKVNYMTVNPEKFLNVYFYYDPDGST